MLRLLPDFYQNLSIWKRLFLKPFSGGITSCRNLGLTLRTIIGGVRSVVSAKRGSLLLAGSAFAADSKADLCLVTGRR